MFVLWVDKAFWRVFAMGELKWEITHSSGGKSDVDFDPTQLVCSRMYSRVLCIYITVNIKDTSVHLGYV